MGIIAAAELSPQAMLAWRALAEASLSEHGLQLGDLLFNGQTIAPPKRPAAESPK